MFFAKTFEKSENRGCRDLRVEKELEAEIWPSCSTNQYIIPCEYERLTPSELGDRAFLNIRAINIKNTGVYKNTPPLLKRILI